MKDCIFCKLANHVFETNVVYEDDIVTCFLDASPVTIGHALVVPKEHFDSLLEVDEKTLSHMMGVAQKLAKAMMKLDGVKGINIVNNCQEVAGQSVMHIHIHVIPRYTSEEFGFKQANNYKLSNEEFAKIVKDIKEKL